MSALCGEPIEHCSRRWLVSRSCVHLPFPDHRHHFYAGHRSLSGVKGFKAEHRTRQPFDAAVILLNDIVQVFTLADLDARMMIVIHLF